MAQLHDSGLVPELLVTDVDASLAFWAGLCGFTVRYHRLGEGFVYLERGRAHVMLEEVGRGRNWITGPLVGPLGRGVNFQIAVDDLEPLVAAFQDAGWPLFMQPERKRYLVQGREVAVHQLLVKDPDGYLLRFQTSAA